MAKEIVITSHVSVKEEQRKSPGSAPHAQAGGEELLANGLGYIFDPIDHLLAWRWIEKLQLGSLEVCCPLAKSPHWERLHQTALAQ